MKSKKRLPKPEAKKQRFRSIHNSMGCLDSDKVKQGSLKGFLRGMEVWKIREKRERF